MSQEFDRVYKKTEEMALAEIDAKGILYEHRKTGARILTISCQDENKVMGVGFRTPALSSRGEAHILEHSVLCGSEKFPCKDLMLELIKGSMNTFLNAMTFPDKTVYPVASMNEQDFMNLAEVYLDAVFHPMVLRDKRIFLQEGWHYETGEDGKLTINGVVFNEMKGVFSNPDSVLSRTVLQSLFPDTSYAWESGGDPLEIPKLEYEEFVEFYHTYYHPSNSYIYFYGNMDMEEKLLWLDKEFLSGFDRLEVHSEITLQHPFSKPVVKEEVYSVTENEGTEGKTQIVKAYVVPFELDGLNDLALEILQFYLMEAPGAPLRERLLGKNLGEDIDGSFERGIRQPYFTVELRNTCPEALGDFKKAIQEILSDIANCGLDGQSLKAAINYIEFKYREADYGSLPSGLQYGLQALDSWLYEKSPFMYLTYDKEFKLLKERIGTGYFEQLIRKCFLENDFSAEVILKPEIGYSLKKQEMIDRMAAEKTAVLTEAQMRQIRLEEDALKKWQETPDSEEVKKTIPRLKITDISPKPAFVPYSLEDGILMSEIPTNGIAYINLIYDLSSFTEEQLQYASFLQSLYGEFDTERHSLKEFTDEMLLKTGGISIDLDNLCLNSKVVRNTPFMPAMRIEIRCLCEQIPDALELAFEMIGEIRLEDEDRLESKLAEEISQMESLLDASMHTLAVNRILSYTEKAYRMYDLTDGIAYYDFLCGVMKTGRSKVHKQRFFRELRKIQKMAAAQPFEAALAGNRKMLSILQDTLEKLGKSGLRKPVAWSQRAGSTKVQAVSNLKEGIKTSSMVNYVSRAGYYLAEGEKGNGAVDVLRSVLSYDYLWPEVRVLGGAYGCILQFSRSGKCVLVSYRDPNLEKTLERFERIPAWLRENELTKEKLEQHIIGSVSAAERPLAASMKELKAINSYYSGYSYEDALLARKQILETDSETIRRFADNLEAMLSDELLCVVGNADQIEKEKRLFRTIRSLKGR